MPIEIQVCKGLKNIRKLFFINVVNNHSGRYDDDIRKLQLQNANISQEICNLHRKWIYELVLINQKIFYQQIYVMHPIENKYKKIYLADVCSIWHRLCIFESQIV